MCETIINEPIDCYRNLNAKGPTPQFSIRAKRINGSGKKSLKVLGHSSCVILQSSVNKPIEFRVGATTRDKVRVKKVKEVHAYCRGGFHSKHDAPIELVNPIEVTYDPYTHDYFKLETGEYVKVTDYRFAVLQNTRIYLMNELPTFIM